MRIKVLILLIVLFFQACSFKDIPNQWQFNSSKAFNSYLKYFLEDKSLLAKSSLKKAISYAKQSSNFEQLARVYLGACALNKSVGLNENCKEYDNLKEFIEDEQLKTYFLMLNNNLKKEQIENLPKQYQGFALNNILKNKKEIFISIKNIEKVSSKFIAASIIKEKLKKEEIKYLIDTASFYGYKKLVLFWLNELLKLEEQFENKKMILKRIEILRN